MEVVKSIKDERIVRVRALRTRAQRAGAGRCVVEGRTLVEQIIDSGVRLETVFRASAAVDETDRSLGERLERSGVPVFLVRDSILRQVIGASKPVSWCGVARFPAEAAAEDSWSEFVVVCDGVADPGNLGAIARSVRALGGLDLVLTDGRTDLSAHRVLESSRGAVLGLRARRFESPTAAMSALSDAGFQIVATAPIGGTLQGLVQLDERPVALVLGGEASGISSATMEAADAVLAIPMTPAVDSLNVAVCAGISIYELRTRLILRTLRPRTRDTIGRSVALAAQLVRDSLHRTMTQSAGLSGSQAIALMVLCTERRTLERDLRDNLNLAAEELDHSLAPLVKRGWLTQADDAYGITGLGEQALASLWPIQEQLEHKLLSGFTTQERATFHELLQRLCANACSRRPNHWPGRRNWRHDNHVHDRCKPSRSETVCEHARGRGPLDQAKFPVRRQLVSAILQALRRT